MDNHKIAHELVSLARSVLGGVRMQMHKNRVDDDRGLKFTLMWLAMPVESHNFIEAGSRTNKLASSGLGKILSSIKRMAPDALKKVGRIRTRDGQDVRGKGAVWAEVDIEATDVNKYEDIMFLLMDHGFRPKYDVTRDGTIK